MTLEPGTTLTFSVKAPRSVSLPQAEEDDTAAAEADVDEDVNGPTDDGAGTELDGLETTVLRVVGLEVLGAGEVLTPAVNDELPL